jgi:hypothetical protein
MLHICFWKFNYSEEDQDPNMSSLVTAYVEEKLVLSSLPWFLELLQEGL